MAVEIPVFLVRHGEAAASWDTHVDPSLSAAGQAQAEALLKFFAHRTPCRLVSSPLQRAQETAAPLAGHWGLPVAIDDRIRELPSGSVPMAERRAWLHGVMRSNWTEVDATLHAWRERAWSALGECREPTVFFTHYMIINALTGRVLDDPRLMVFEPDYCSITELAVGPASCRLVALGKARTTLVL